MLFADRLYLCVAFVFLALLIWTSIEDLKTQTTSIWPWLVASLLGLVIGTVDPEIAQWVLRHQRAVGEGLPSYDWTARSASALTTALIGYVLWALAVTVDLDGVMVPLGEHRMRNAVRVFASNLKDGALNTAVLMVLAAAIPFIWHAGGARWIALSNALHGLGAGIAIVGVVMVAGTWCFRQPAMGSADGLCVAAVGTLLGPVGAILVFFLTPFSALVVGLALVVITRNRKLALVPYLAFSSMLLICWWPSACSLISKHLRY